MMPGLGNNFYDNEPGLPVMTRPNKRGKRYSKRALAGVGVIAAAAAGVGLGVGAQAKNVQATPKHLHEHQQPPQTYMAQQGDTLSSIVERLTHKDDVRPEVYDLEQTVKINDSHPNRSIVQPGDTFQYEQGGHVIETKETS